MIGVALFRERERPAPYAYENRAPEAASSAGAAARQSAGGAQRPVGRARGGDGSTARDRARSAGALPVEQVEFERASASPDQRIVIRYDRRENLVAMGVLPPAARWHEPDPFPATLGFVPDP